MTDSVFQAEIQELIVVRVELWEPTGSLILRFAHEIAPENSG
jgi:hypothetical protein